MTFIVVREGAAFVDGAFGRWSIREGDVLALQPRMPVSVMPERRLAATVLQIELDYLLEQMVWRHGGFLANRNDARRLFMARYPHSAQLLRLAKSQVRLVTPWLDELVELCASGEPDVRFYRVQGLAFQIIDALLPHLDTGDDQLVPCLGNRGPNGTSQSRNPASLRAEAHNAAHLIRDYPECEWTLAELATAVHLSVSQFGRIFVSAFGQTPIAYLTAVRVEKMETLLRRTDMPVSAIGGQVGWRDPDYAARQFRRHFGVSPRQYRQLSSARPI